MKYIQNCLEKKVILDGIASDVLRMQNIQMDIKMKTGK